MEININRFKNFFSLFDLIFIGLNILCYGILPFIFQEEQKEVLSRWSVYLITALDKKSIETFFPIVIISLTAIIFGVFTDKFFNNEVKISTYKSIPSDNLFFIFYPFLLLYLYPSGSFIINILRDIPVIYSAYNIYLNRVIGRSRKVMFLSYLALIVGIIWGIIKIALMPILIITSYILVALIISQKKSSSKLLNGLLTKKKFFKNFLYFILGSLSISFFAIVSSIKGILRVALNSVEFLSNPLDWIPFIRLDLISENWTRQILIRLNQSIVLSNVVQKKIELGINTKPYIIHAWTSFIPRFIYPDKPINTIGNYFGRDFGHLEITDFSTSVNLPFLVQNYIIFGAVLIFIPMFIQGFLYSYLTKSLVQAKKFNQLIKPHEFISSVMFFSYSLVSIENSYSAFATALVGYYIIKFIFLTTKYTLAKKSLT